MEDNQNPVDQSVDSQDGGEPVDQVRNLKAEFSRKTDNLASQIAAQNAQLQAILESVQASMKPAQQAQPTRKLSELLFEDADAAATEIENRAAKIAERVIEQKVQLSQKSQQVVSDVLNVYPEFGAPNSEASALAIQKVSSLPKHLQGTPEGTKMAMMEAAAELGLIPAKARKQSASNDDFVVGGQTKATSRRQADPTKDIPAETLAFAQALGRDINDPKVLEGLRQASKRNFSRYS
jgi:hypothetical protein